MKFAFQISFVSFYEFFYILVTEEYTGQVHCSSVFGYSIEIYSTKVKRLCGGYHNQFIL